MKIIDKTYFHFQRINETNISWKVGDIVIFDSNRNNYYFSSLIKSVHEILTENNIPLTTWSEVTQNILNKKKSETLQTEFNQFLKLLKQKEDKNKLIQYIQELIFEQVRKEKFNSLPSRHYCIWVLPKQEELIEWKNILACFRSRSLKLRLTGEIHKTTGSLISVENNQQINNAYENANKYWKPNFQISNESEYLFEGKVEIIEELLA